MARNKRLRQKPGGSCRSFRYFIDIIPLIDSILWLQETLERLIQNRRRNKIVFVGLTLSHVSSSYTSWKYALNILTETLRPEGLLYYMDIHIFFAAMWLPELVEETKIKPALTRKSEGNDKNLSCEEAAKTMLKDTPNDLSPNVWC